MRRAKTRLQQITLNHSRAWISYPQKVVEIVRKKGPNKHANVVEKTKRWSKKDKYIVDIPVIS